jgi:Zinc-binding domain of primase-helicase
VVGQRIDADAIKARVDLVDLAGRDVHLRKVATTRGGEWAGPCPFCGGRDRFRVQPEKGLWFCRQCSPNGPLAGRDRFRDEARRRAVRRGLQDPGRLEQ